jgi:hypothetical protein
MQQCAAVFALLRYDKLSYNPIACTYAALLRTKQLLLFLNRVSIAGYTCHGSHHYAVLLSDYFAGCAFHTTLLALMPALYHM